jgi:hypothetical protein
MLAIARQTVSNAEFIHADMLEMEVADRVAAVIAWDSIFHVDRRQHGRLFGKIRGLVVEGGWLLLSAGGTSEEGFSSEMFGHRFYYSGYAPEQTATLLEASGFKVQLCEIDDASSRGHVAIIALAAANGA